MKLIGHFEIRRIKDSTCGEIVYCNEIATHEDERITSATQNQAQALHILHEEIEEAVSRANSRLKSGGLDKWLFTAFE
ncbi:MAG: hypothetical protein K2K82_07750 [Muribaculaceae bacterium]|nr:hypothetical protein [Muribaculaceae bacterium]